MRQELLERAGRGFLVGLHTGLFGGLFTAAVMFEFLMAAFPVLLNAHVMGPTSATLTPFLSGIYASLFGSILGSVAGAAAGGAGLDLRSGKRGALFGAILLAALGLYPLIQSLHSGIALALVLFLFCPVLGGATAGALTGAVAGRLASKTPLPR
jgi:hypothetical protein